MKKLTAFLLVLVMVLSILPTAAFAAPSAFEEKGFVYNKIGRNAMIIGYKDSDREVVIPETLYRFAKEDYKSLESKTSCCVKTAGCPFFYRSSAEFIRSVYKPKPHNLCNLIRVSEVRY